MLGVPRIGVHDNFFEAGGHSLLVIRVLARVEEAFGVNLPIETAFAAPSLGEMAACLDLLAWHADGAGCAETEMVAGEL